MPRGIKRRAKTRVEWNKHHRAQLLSGFDMFGRAFGEDDPGTFDEESARVAWEELRDELIGATPFRRPWAWWKFDAPEPRKLSAKDEATDAEEWIGSPAWWARFREGVRPEDVARLNLVSRGCESFRDYLSRLGLLTPEELRLVESVQPQEGEPCE